MNKDPFLYGYLNLFAFLFAEQSYLVNGFWLYKTYDWKQITSAKLC